MGSERINTIIIVTNTKCYNKILQIKKEYYNDNTNIICLINNIDCRIESMNTALKYIKNNKFIIEINIAHTLMLSSPEPCSCFARTPRYIPVHIIYISHDFFNYF